MLGSAGDWLDRMPDDVVDQDRQIRQAGILNVMQTALGQREGLLHWAAVLSQPYGTSDLCLCAGYREGEFRAQRIRRAAFRLAHNGLLRTYDGISPPLTLQQLQLLERLAIGQEEFALEYGRRFVYTGIVPPSQDLLFPAGTQLEVEVVTFGHVHFRQAGTVLRSQVTSPAFKEIPTWRP